MKYCFTTRDGETVERSYPMGKAPSEVTLKDGRIALRDYFAERVTGFVSGTGNPVRSGGWPMKPCVASGVNAEQAGELRDYLSERGCPTEITPDGDPVYTSPAHRRKALKLRGMHDRNSFF